MRLLVVGGHTRNIGKTALVVELIRAFPAAAWTAVKITQYGHGLCSVHGEPCACTPDGDGVALVEERDPDGGTDTSRFLSAGALRAFWLRTRQGDLGAGMPLLRKALKGSENVIIESNALLQFLHPQLYLVVLDIAQSDFKANARRFLDRADGYVLRASLKENTWPGVSGKLLEGKPAFHQPLGAPLPDALLALIGRRFFQAGQSSVSR